MQISNLKTLATPNLNDVLPILDINGGASGKPILRKVTLQSIFALAPSFDLTSINDSIEALQNGVPTLYSYPVALISGNNTLSLSKNCLISKIESDTAIRLRIYKNAVYRESDKSRTIETYPTGNHGLILEVGLTALALTQEITSGIFASDTDTYPCIASNSANITITYLSF